MEHVRAPAFLAYRNGDLFATIVDVLRQLPGGRSCSSASLEDLLKEYVYFYNIIIIIILSFVCWALILLFLLGALCQVLKEENDDRLSLTNDINCCSCRYRIF